MFIEIELFKSKDLTTSSISYLIIIQNNCAANLDALKLKLITSNNKNISAVMICKLNCAPVHTLFEKTNCGFGHILKILLFLLNKV